MKTFKFSLVVVAIAVLSTSPNAQTFKFSVIQSPYPMTGYLSAQGINDQGEILFQASSGRAFILVNSVLVPLPSQFGDEFSAINNKNVVIGSGTKTVGFNSHPVGFIIDAKGNRTQFNPVDLVLPLAINNSGAVVGQWPVSTQWPILRGDVLGFFDINGVSKTYEYPGSDGTIVRAINDLGGSAGIYYMPGVKEYGFQIVNGKPITLEAPSQLALQPNAINNHGSIVGVYTTQSENPQSYPILSGMGFVRSQSGKVVTIDFSQSGVAPAAVMGPKGPLLPLPGQTVTSVNGINNQGVIAGSSLIGYGDGCYYQYSNFAFTAICNDFKF